MEFLWPRNGMDDIRYGDMSNESLYSEKCIDCNFQIDRPTQILTKSCTHKKNLQKNVKPHKTQKRIIISGWGHFVKVKGG